MDVRVRDTTGTEPGLLLLASAVADLELRGNECEEQGFPELPELLELLELAPRGRAQGVDERRVQS